MSRTICYCWELGGGFGHVNRFEPIARRLQSLGWRVIAVVKDLKTSAKVFHGLRIELVQAPPRPKRSRAYIDQPVTFGDLLSNLGYRDALELDAYLRRWRIIFESFRPDLLLLDHAPTAALATRAVGVAKATLGTGFCCPPALIPLPPMAPWSRVDGVQLLHDENTLVRHINAVLDHNQLQPLDNLADLYHSLDANVLATFREMDHYLARPQGEYVGTWTTHHKSASKLAFTGWPSRPGCRIFAYLKNFPALQDIARWLNDQPHATVLVVDKVPLHGTLSKCRNIAIYDQPVCLDELRNECDLAILNGNHGVTSEFLLSGVPTLQIPLVLEQAITSDRVHGAGAGLPGNAADSRQIIQQINRLLSESTWRDGAQRFQATHIEFSATAAIEQVVSRLVNLT